jgi:two-component system cell cycle response regulator
MAYLLTAFGHQVLQAHEGLMGIETARREMPDLILLDIHMPRMDGYEVAHWLRADAECSKIPLVAVTALAMVGDREKILASGFDGYIAKPLDPETFAAEVNGFLGLAPPSEPQNHVSPGHDHSQIVPLKDERALVLFVDNLQANIDLVRSTLEPSGYQVIAARSVKEGLELALRRKPDLIVSDVHMPHQDGYDFIRLVRAEPELAKIPFVFLSSSVWSTREQRNALLRGAKKFLARPIEPQVLLEELKDCIGQPASRGQEFDGGG